MVAGRAQPQGVGRRPVEERIRGGYKGEARGGGGAATSASDAVEGKWGVRVHQKQEMKGKEGTGDLGRPDSKSGRYSSGSGLCPSGEKAFFADVAKSLRYQQKRVCHPFTSKLDDLRETRAQDNSSPVLSPDKWLS